MAQTILVTGATGNVGYEVLSRLPADWDVRAAHHNPAKLERPLPRSVPVVPLDFTRPETFAAAFEGVRKVFLMRPPALADVKRYFTPAIEAAERAGVEHIVFLSLLGAESNPIIPHAKIEKVLQASRIAWTFIRAGFFMQNLSTTHRTEIRDRSELVIPAGQGTTSFTDVRDIAAVAALALTEPGHENQAYPITGSEALTYSEVAQILSEELGRMIAYRSPSLPGFFFEQKRKGASWDYALVTTVIYGTARAGKAGTVTRDFTRLTGCEPITVRQFARDYREAWL